MTMRVFVVLAWLIAVLSVSVTAGASESLWIDVRTAEEYSEIHVEQAINIPYDQIAAEITAVTSEKDALIYVYCRSGRRSGIAKSTLEGLGYTRVVNAGGIEDALATAGQQAKP